MTIADSINTTLLKSDNAKVFMGLVEERSQTTDKSLAGTLMSSLTTMKFMVHVLCMSMSLRWQTLQQNLRP